MSQNQRDKQAYLSATPMQREVVRRLLCDVLGCLRSQYLSYQTSHWQVVGQSFYGNHLLFQRLYKSVREQVDQLAEKLVGYLGREVVGLDHQIKHIAGYTMRWSQIDCHHKRGLQSEADLQAALKRAYDGIKQVNAMTLGLDDWIMATANAHDENEYLLQQALTQVPGRRTASKPFRLSPKEINRADRSIPGRPFTIISRPQSDGSYMVAAVDPDTGMLVFSGAFEYADDKRGVADAIRRLNRDLDKNTGLATKMTSRSRHQHRASGAQKKASTNTYRYFYKATDGKWYVENESYEEDWDTGEQIEGEMTHYGPFPSFKAAEKYMDRNFANSGSYHEDDSGRQRPPRNPVKPGRGRRLWGSSFKRPDGFYLERHAPMGRDDFNNYEFVNKYDPAARYWKPMDKKELDRILAYWKRTKADWAWRWEEVRGGRVVKKDEGSGTRFERSYDGPGIYDSGSDSYFRRRSAVAPAAPSEEHRFFDNPERREVREFANTGAISNSPEIAAAAAAEDRLDVSGAKAVAEAEAAPPTPEEIKAEPGGKAVSTLNRFVVESEDPDAGQAAEYNKPLLESKKLMAAWLREIEND